jgi:EAL domain-containing protein (putative c-di-GMP-specific phosphodiesterase class I)
MTVIDQVNQLEVSITMADVEMGSSSFAYLAALNPRIMKVDQSFVRPAQESARNDTPLETITSVGQRPNVTMLAQGIENKTQFDRLRGLSCELGGHLFSLAMPTSEFVGMVGLVLSN